MLKRSDTGIGHCQWGKSDNNIILVITQYNGYAKYYYCGCIANIIIIQLFVSVVTVVHTS